ncbi:MAG: serine/threonine-protein phosphatase [Myxococcales bacterium]|nr:serine/threonine-protein phosphatase [Myxococcales bacterium]
MYVECKSRTHQGRRSTNQDSWCAEPGLGLYAVADGMGGYAGGEVASRVAIGTLADFFRRNHEDENVTWPFPIEPARSYGENLLDVAVRYAHLKVCAEKTAQTASMGTTVAALLLDASGHVVVGHVGDSRVYCLRDGMLYQLTRDHSLYDALQRAGFPNLPERDRFPMGHVITQALGMEGRSPQPEVRRERLRHNDTFLLCTDGLLETVDPQTIAQVLAENTPADAADELVQQAFERGGEDNITVVVLKVHVH